MEKRWERAKKIVSAEYGLDESDPRFWALTTGVVKKMSGIKEHMTFKQYLENYTPHPSDEFSELGFERSVEHKGKVWTATGKLLTNTSTGKEVQVAEYLHRDKQGESRIYMDKEGNVYSDSY